MKRRPVMKIKIDSPVTWQCTKQTDGTWLATCELLDLTVQLTANTLEKQLQEITEVMKMTLESLYEKGVLQKYLMKHGVSFTEISTTDKSLDDFQYIPFPVSFSPEAPLAVGA